MGTLSTVSFGLSQGTFGTGKKALVAAYVSGFVWLVPAAVFIYGFAGSFSDLMSPETAAAFILSSIPVGSSFFIAYLLWRTNNDVG